MLSKFYLHQGKNKKAENGRPWIYIDEINEYDGDYENGDIVEVYNHKNYFIGKGYINDRSKITIRIMTRNQEEEIDKEFFRKRYPSRAGRCTTAVRSSNRAPAALRPPAPPYVWRRVSRVSPARRRCLR